MSHSDVAFDRAKRELLNGLNSGVDSSPKGSLDEPIYDLVRLLNGHENYVTTSSCSGRIAVFMSGNANTKGVQWILVKHGELRIDEFLHAISSESIQRCFQHCAPESQTLSVKSEGLILHLQCRDLNSGSTLLNIVRDCGYRESGLSLSADGSKVMLAVRSMAFTMEVPLSVWSCAYSSSCSCDSAADSAAVRTLDIVREEALGFVLEQLNSRLRANFARADQLMLKLKQQFEWPKLIVMPFDCKQTSCRSLERWGHAAVLRRGNSSEDEAIVVVGGVRNASNTSDDDDDNTCMISLSSSLSSSCQSNGRHELPAALRRRILHAEVASWGRAGGYVVCGGRVGGSAAEPLLRVFDENMTCELRHVESGDIPEPRWGHTFTRLRHPDHHYNNDDDGHDDVYVLIGGRNASTVFGDCFIVTRKEHQHQHRQHDDDDDHDRDFDQHFDGGEWHFRRLSLVRQSHHNDDAAAPELLQRFHHAATALYCRRSHSAQSRFPMAVLVVGGISALDSLSAVRTMVLVHPELDRVDEVTVASAETADMCARFAHAMTSVGAGTVLVDGGVVYPHHDVHSAADAASPSSPSSSSSSSSLVLDMTFSKENRPMIQSRVVHWHRDADGSAVEARDHLPQRVHHRMLWSPPRSFNSLCGAVHVVGGGCPCLSFGSYFTPSVSLRVVTRHSSDHHTRIDGQTTSHAAPASSSQSSSCSSSQSSSSSSLAAAAAKSSSSSSEHVCVLLMAAAAVKAVKEALQTSGLLSKRYRIWDVSDLQSSDTQLIALAHYADGEMTSLTLSSSASAKTDSECILLNSAAQNLIDGRTCKAIPLTMMTSASPSSSASLESLLRSLAPHVLTENIIIIADTVPMRRDNDMCRSSSSASRANEVISAFFKAQQHRHHSHHHALPSVALPAKYEIVGDVVMLPNDEWLDAMLSQLDEKQTDALFASLLRECFPRCTRVARKAEIDSGPRRESRVRLLFPVRGQPHDTGPGSAGWVTVVENRVSFSFDITRVMFCSGNCTERMRMGRVAAAARAAPEHIVDLFCGIGYYTVPLLRFGHSASTAVACEWNPNSVLSLRCNLADAGIASSRVVILEGDNRQTVTQDMDDTADRVLLGLLPTSQMSWASAARVLKRSGGVIHVHENVHEASLQRASGASRSRCRDSSACWFANASDCETSFEAFVVRRFEEYFRQLRKPMRVMAEHTEVVKSYAPRVLHVVVDLRCIAADL